MTNEYYDADWLFYLEFFDLPESARWLSNWHSDQFRHVTLVSRDNSNGQVLQNDVVFDVKPGKTEQTKVSFSILVQSYNLEEDVYEI